MSGIEALQNGTAARNAFAGAATEESSSISSDFETFLKMLTVQLENQDPLNPMDSAEYALQLATFSGVEQQVLTNDLLKAMTVQMGAAGLGEYASWVGRQARVESPVAYDGTAIPVVVEPPDGAEAAFLVARDDTGRELDRRLIDVADGEIQWRPDVALTEGTIVSFSVESVAEGEALDAVPAQVYARIEEVRVEPRGTAAVLPGGTVVPVDEITALRDG
ncbi:flagellar hook capping FlgD N-terminal domain-containing protein [Pelagovum pacificum]|uniref:Basal-body rod modification protein FlgD n=1 Tax=Pelagovum pacificum TaxID=2588711 RepID=A0A5C5GGJ5_9RHOB|nr:flagellar hook capping FlgD N-terminal domain-containing protein [Pelagovum pacificum]QQA42993.1 flagellar hook assembly protein FlgD [Pelagovum pacificum]TNY33862.1 flagellar basal body rod modification protein [Pelagovum pacificum]